MSLLDHLPGGISKEDLVVGMAMLTTVMTTYAIWQTLIVRDRFAPRLRMLSRRRAVMRGEFLSGEEASDDGALSAIRRVVERLKLI